MINAHSKIIGSLLSMILFLCISLPGFAQEVLPFVHYNTDDGLSEGTINAIFQDSRGYMWFGTNGGLNQFDGYEFTAYTSNPENPNSILSNNILSINETHDGKLLVGTGVGLSVFNPSTGLFTNYVHDTGDVQSIGQGQINVIFVDSDNRIWIGTAGGGLSKFDASKGVFERFEHNPINPNGISGNTVYGIQEGSNGSLWIGASTNRVDLMDTQDGTFRSYNFLPDGQAAFMRGLYVDSNQKVWVTTENAGIFTLENTNSQFRPFTLESLSGNSINNVRVVREDSQGNKWFGTDGFGIQKIEDNGNLTYVRNNPFFDNSLISDQVYTIHFDRSGGMWVGVFKKGLSYHNPSRHKFSVEYKVAGIENSLTHNSVLAVHTSRRGGVWIGTDGGGMDYFDPATGSYQHFKHDPNNDNSLSTNVIKSIYETSDGIIWAGTYLGGINRLDPRTGNVLRISSDPGNVNSLAVLHVWAIQEDKDGDLWFGLLGGLNRYDPDTGQMQFYDVAEDESGLSNGSIYDLTYDSKDRLWIGTADGGVNRFNPVTDSFIWYQNDPSDPGSLPNGQLQSIYEAADGKIWVGTTNGLATYEESADRFIAHPINDLLVDRQIRSIQEDFSGNLWISSTRGLTKFNPATNELDHFTKNDGLQGNEFNYASAARDSNGRLFFGGLNGFNHFIPEAIQTNSYDPPVELTELRVFDQIITPQVSFNGRKIIDKPIENLEHLTLNHKENYFSLSFSALDYTSPDQNNFQYILENFDEEWTSKTADERQAIYMNLDPGNYIFKVKGSNSDGVWSTETKDLEITILPPWWGTWWFRTLLVIIIGSAVFLVVRWRNNLNKQNTALLQSKINEATTEVLKRNEELQEQQNALGSAVKETNEVVAFAVHEGSFSKRINLEDKSGDWLHLGESINELFGSIVTPMAIINEIVNKMAEGDLRGRYVDEAKGEIKDLADNLNAALENLSGLLSEVITEIESIGEASTEMLTGSEEMDVSTSEIASAIAEMSKGAQQQVQKVDESSALVEHVQNVSRSVGQQAKTINDAAGKGVDISESGKKVISELSQNMQKTLELSGDTQESIQDLTRVSGEITRILNIIKEVAAQTNLLALNAAIEAAQAGELGRGFAVVAEEIRKLAEDSRNSTKEIESLVSEVQNKTKTTASLVSEMDKSIKLGEESSNAGIQSFNDIASSYAQTLELSNQILSDTEQQSKAVADIRSITETIVVIAEETASGTEEVASSASQLSAGMKHFKELTERVGMVARNLVEKVQKFKI